MKVLVGSYKLFSDKQQGEHYLPDTTMRKRFFETFGRYRPALNDALASEDYEDAGLIDLTQVREAIVSVVEDVADDLVDWMLYQIYSRSESIDRMKYRTIIDVLDEVIK